MTVRRPHRFWLLHGGTVAGLALMFIPIAIVVVWSFNSATRGMTWERFSFSWYIRVWSNPDLMRALGNSLKAGVLAGAISLVVGSCAALLVVSLEGRLHRILAGLVFVPIVAPDLMIALANLLSITTVGLPASIGAIAMAQATVGSAYTALLVIIRLLGAGYSSYVLAAASLGASPQTIVRDHFIPLAAPAAAVGAVIAGLISLQDVLYAFYLGGPGDTTLAVYLFGLVRFGPNGGLNVVYTLLMIVGVLIVLMEERYAR